MIEDGTGVTDAKKYSSDPDDTEELGNIVWVVSLSLSLSLSLPIFLWEIRFPILYDALYMNVGKNSTIPVDGLRY
jgi:hypothetical protein